MEVHSRAYNGFSGIDFRAYKDGKFVAALQAISYSVCRDPAPIYTLPNTPPPRKEYIAGTLLFSMLDFPKTIQLYPFDVKLTAAANDKILTMEINGIEIKNVTSDKLKEYEGYTYIAKQIIGWH